MRIIFVAMLVTALAITSREPVQAGTQTAQLDPGVELQITPEAAPPYFDVDQTIKVSGFPLFPQGMKLRLTSAQYNPQNSQLVTPSPIPTYVPGVGNTLVPAPSQDFAENNVVSTTTQCGDTVNFVIEAKQGKNIFYVITKTTQFVKIWC